jgi:hypothetical protein
VVEADVPLFSYGTLQLPVVQFATFGRLLEGIEDSLTGHRLVPLTITSDHVVALSGAAVHQIAVPTGNPDDRVPGIVFLLTADEIEAADRYEVDAYGRIEVALASGRRAFVYVGGTLPPEWLA